jgi:general stress protein YciG
MKKNKALTVSEMGRKGGQATLKKKGRKHYSEIARKGWETRRKNAKAAKK